MNKTVPFDFGSEVYTWFMHQGGKTYTNKLGPIMEVIAEAGFTGVQPIHFWMGDLSDPGLLAAKLNNTGLKLAALSLALPWQGDTETEQERKEADQVISVSVRSATTDEV